MHDIESLRPLIEKYGWVQVWHVAIEKLGFPPTWDLSINQILKLKSELEN